MVNAERKPVTFPRRCFFGQATEGVPCSGELKGLYSPRARRVPPMGFDPHAFRVLSKTTITARREQAIAGIIVIQKWYDDLHPSSIESLRGIA
jgi:hypothetical protein